MTVRSRLAAAVALGILVGAPQAVANDSSAELKTGGLVLIKSAGIDMKSEDLFISESEVRVDYRFLNVTKKDLKVTVAFPMPNITVDGPDDNISIPTEDPVNILAFTTRVDGHPVSARVEQRAFRGGVDRTELLKSLGVPLAPHLPSAEAALDRLPQAKKNELIKLGLVEVEEYDAGKGMMKHYEPRWTLKTTYYWDQVFPAGREIRVQHRYKPSVGESAGTSIGSDTFKASEEYKYYMDRYCLDDGLFAAVGRIRKAMEADYAPLTEKRIGYVLKSGANWKSPIGDFHLTIDKGRADSLLSVCIDGIRKTGPTRFEVRKTNFRPDKDLNILILVRAPSVG